ncbi:MAG: hypothetical protein LAN84_07700 [Acidobacteriia bacterium]|nr:hypothetical protein [Terriglobia bacterium]
MTTASKTLPPPAGKPAPRANPARDRQWAEARSLFPIYTAIARQVGIKPLFGPDKTALPETVSPEIFDQVTVWLNTVDTQVQVHQLRHLLQMTSLNANEGGLRAMILRHLRKTIKSDTDRHKIDFLLVQYFALCAPPKIYHAKIELEDVAQVMKPVLGEADAAPLEWCAPLETIIATLGTLRSLREMLKTNFIEQGRRVKDSAGNMFYDPSALLAFIRFNFMLRRTLIELMHADLAAIRTGLTQMEAAHVRTVDCTQFGLSASEPLAKIRQIADEWKQPFQKDYTERTVNQGFEKLLALRNDVERALAGVSGKPAPAAAAPAAKTAPPAAKPAAPQKTPPPPAPAVRQEKPAAAPVPALDFETCMEKIWEQLIAAPPTRGRSMTTITLGTARVLLPSWEVTAFVSEDGPSAEDLRRAVVARALVTAALEAAKETGNASSLERAISIARVEASRLQERVDIAKQAKDTEVAVNLSMSTKRLLSALDEAEKL